MTNPPFTGFDIESYFICYPDSDPDELLEMVVGGMRMDALLTMQSYIEEEEWFRLLGRHWSACDRIGADGKVLRRILRSATPVQIDMMMTDRERAFRDQLPEKFIAYRGCYELNRDGLSYSSRKEIAEKFPFLARYRQQSGQPLLLTARVDRIKAIVKLDRGEREIIAVNRRIVCTEPLHAAPTDKEPYQVIIRVRDRELPWNSYWDLDDAETAVQKLRGHGHDARIEERPRVGS
jgi:hypothetical protein